MTTKLTIITIIEFLSLPHAPPSLSKKAIHFVQATVTLIWDPAWRCWSSLRGVITVFIESPSTVNLNHASEIPLACQIPPRQGELEHYKNRTCDLQSITASTLVKKILWTIYFPIWKVDGATSTWINRDPVHPFSNPPVWE